MALDVQVVFEVDTSGLTDAQQALQDFQDKTIQIKVETDTASVSDLRDQFDRVVRSVDPASAAVQDFSAKLQVVKAYGSIIDPNDETKVKAVAAAEQLLTDKLNARLEAVRKTNDAVKTTAAPTGDLGEAKWQKLQAAIDPAIRLQQQYLARMQELDNFEREGGKDVTAIRAKAVEAYEAQSKALESLGKTAHLNFSSIINEARVMVGELAAGRTSNLFTSLGREIGFLKIPPSVLLSYGALAGVIAGVTYEVVKLSSEYAKLGQEARLSGTGASGADLVADARKYADQLGISGTSARSAVGSFVSAGITQNPMSSDTMKLLLQDTKDLAMVTGDTLPDAAKKLAASLSDPAAAMKKLAETYHQVSAEQVELVARLQASGQLLEAQRAVAAANADAVGHEAEISATAWTRLGAAVSRVWDHAKEGFAAMIGFGGIVGNSATEKLDTINNTMAAMKIRIADLQEQSKGDIFGSVPRGVTKELTELKASYENLIDVRKRLSSLAYNEQNPVYAQANREYNTLSPTQVAANSSTYDAQNKARKDAEDQVALAKKLQEDLAVIRQAGSASVPIKNSAVDPWTNAPMTPNAPPAGRLLETEEEKSNKIFLQGAQDRLASLRTINEVSTHQVDVDQQIAGLLANQRESATARLTQEDANLKILDQSVDKQQLIADAVEKVRIKQKQAADDNLRNIGDQIAAEQRLFDAAGQGGTARIAAESHNQAVAAQQQNPQTDVVALEAEHTVAANLKLATAAKEVSAATQRQTADTKLLAGAYRDGEDAVIRTTAANQAAEERFRDGSTAATEYARTLELIAQAYAKVDESASRNAAATTLQITAQRNLTAVAGQGLVAQNRIQAQNQARQEVQQGTLKPEDVDTRAAQLFALAQEGIATKTKDAAAAVQRQIGYQIALNAAYGKGAEEVARVQAANQAAEDAITKGGGASAAQRLAEEQAKVAGSTEQATRQFVLQSEGLNKLADAYGKGHAAALVQSAQTQAALEVEAHKISADQEQVRVLQLLTLESDKLGASTAQYIAQLRIATEQSSRVRTAAFQGAPAERQAEVRSVAESRIRPDIDAATAALAQAKAIGDVNGAMVAEQRLQKARNDLETVYQGELSRSTDAAVKSLANTAQGIQQSIELTQKEMDTWNLSFSERSKALDELKIKQEIVNAGIAEGTDAYNEMYGVLSKLKDQQRSQAEESRSFLGGIKEAWASLSDEATNYGKQAGDIFKQTFHDASDTLADFLTTGKADWQGFLASLSKSLASSGIQSGLAELGKSVMSIGTDSSGGGTSMIGSLLKSIGLGGSDDKSSAGGSALGKLAGGAGSSVGTMTVQANVVNISGGVGKGIGGDDSGSILDKITGRERTGGVGENAGKSVYDSSIGPSLDGEVTGGDASTGFFSSLKSQFTSVTDDISSGFDTVTGGVSDAFDSVAGDLGDAFGSVASGVGDAFGSVASSLGDSLSTVFSSISSLFSGGGDSGIGSMIGSAASSYAAYAAAANGMVMQNNVQTYATGGQIGPGMYDHPTFAPMADGRTAEIGEAGPEAVLPLARGPDGKLGIAGGSSGAAPINISNNVTINNPQGDATEVSAAVMKQMNMMIQSKVIQQIADAQRSGGQLNPLPMRAM